MRHYDLPITNHEENKWGFVHMEHEVENIYNIITTYFSNTIFLPSSVLAHTGHFFLWTGNWILKSFTNSGNVGNTFSYSLNSVYSHTEQL